MKEISISDIGPISIGQAENEQAATGVTVIISKNGMPAGMAVRGGGPASRETALLDPLAHADRINAIVLAGGSAFGLDASGGVMKYLEEHGIGYDVGITHVPLVCSSCLFDLAVGDCQVRPDAAMGYEACINAETGNYRDGNHGAGTGATVGKLLGAARCMKSGIGSYAVQVGDLKLGVIAAVNSLGDIYSSDGKRIAGLLDESRTQIIDSCDTLYGINRRVENRFVSNTIIGVIITNAFFDKAQLCKIASMGHNGMARAVRPVHTSADGDTLYAVSVGNVQADKDTVGTLAADVTSKAIERAVLSAQSAYGFPAARDIIHPEVCSLRPYGLPI